MAIIDRLILLLFEPREIVEIVVGRGGRGGGKGWVTRSARLKFQDLPERSGVMRIGLFDNRL